MPQNKTEEMMKIRKFINRMTIEGDCAYPTKARFKDQSFYVLETDKDGYQKVVVYKIMR